MVQQIRQFYPNTIEAAVEGIHEAERTRDEEPPQDDGPPYTDAVDDQDGMSELERDAREDDHGMDDYRRIVAEGLGL